VTLLLLLPPPLLLLLLLLLCSNLEPRLGQMPLSHPHKDALTNTIRSTLRLSTSIVALFAMQLSRSSQLPSSAGLGKVDHLRSISTIATLGHGCSLLGQAQFIITTVVESLQLIKE
jgi:hypothetical protein